MSFVPGNARPQPFGRIGHVDPAPLGCAGPQLGDRAMGNDPAVVDDRDPVAQPFDELELVAREEDRHARVGLFAQDARS